MALLLLNAAKQGRTTAAARALVAQTARGLATEKSSGFPCTAGARERALVTLDLPGNALWSPSTRRCPRRHHSRDLRPKPRAFRTPEPRGDRHYTWCPSPRPCSSRLPPWPGPAAKKLALEGKAAPSLVKKKAAAITEGVRSYVTRRCWPCQAPPEAWDDQEKAIAKVIAAHLNKMEEALGERITKCWVGNQKLLIEQTRRSHWRLALLAAALMKLFRMRFLDFLDCPELFAVLRRHQDEAQNQLLEFSREPEACELRRVVAAEVWDAAVKDIFTARSLRQMIKSLFWSSKGAGARDKKSPVAIVPAGAQGNKKQ
ncbi:hypothetical protein OsJ_23005 [Oryza sativa Japonica Group]|uniref:Uncharacterized protein n=1 Tax=Oryza sativa subsp. japonica TaxID=39947 RepID=A3BGC6_ORYSJ|nr:hypothetical protein OsJ_23005 [Oryza sativa Japonica Group]